MTADSITFVLSVIAIGFGLAAVVVAIRRRAAPPVTGLSVIAFATALIVVSRSA